MNSRPLAGGYHYAFEKTAIKITLSSFNKKPSCILRIPNQRRYSNKALKNNNYPSNNKIIIFLYD